MRLFVLMDNFRRALTRYSSSSLAILPLLAGVLLSQIAYSADLTSSGVLTLDSKATKISLSHHQLLASDQCRFFPTGDTAGEAGFNIENILATARPVASVGQLKVGCYWLRITVSNRSARNDWVISFSNYLLDSVGAYQKNSQGDWLHREGYNNAFKYPYQRGVSLDVRDGGTAELFVYFKSKYLTGSPRIEIIPQPDFQQQMIYKSSLVVAALGGMAVLAVYSLVVGRALANRSHLFFALYLLASIGTWAGLATGQIKLLDWQFSLGFVLPLSCVGIFYSLYVIQFFNLDKDNTKLARVGYGIIVIYLLLFVIDLLSSSQIPLHVMGLNAIVCLLFALICGLYYWRKGDKAARFFVLGNVVFLIGSMVGGFQFYALTDTYENSIVTLGAQLVDVLLLSLALYERIAMLQKERQAVLEQANRTERRALAKENSANVKLREALQLSETESQRKSDFIQMVSHELRTPLHSIVTAVDQWQSSDDGFAQQDLMQFIAYGANRLNGQIDNLVLLVETEDMKQAPNVSSFDINALLQSLCESALQLKLENVEFNFEVRCDNGGDELPDTVRGDAYLIKNLLRVLIENACENTERGRIDLLVCWDSYEQALKVNLQDTGCGMSRDQQKGLFSAFVQVSRGRDSDISGLGLGLTICHRISHILSVDLQIDSDPGVGTRVSLLIPLEVDNSVEARRASANGKVLIVEDNQVNARILERILGHLDYEADLVFSGQEALQTLQENSYQIIFMDIKMPVMDGITATRWMRQRGITTPIVAITADSDQDVRRHCYDVGMNDLLIKPVRRVDIQRVLDRQSCAG